MSQNNASEFGRAESSRTGRSLVFVTGASRSGTTMLARVLGAHSRIFATNELHFFGEIWDPSAPKRAWTTEQLAEMGATLRARQDKSLWNSGPSESDTRWAREVVSSLPNADRDPPSLYAAALARLAEESGKDIACEQTPRNIYYADELLKCYPQARIVHIVRDPRAVLASQKNRWQLKKLGADHLPVLEMVRNWINYHPYTMSKLWLRANNEALRLREHERFHMLRFEDLAENSERGLRQVCEFLGVQFEPDMLNVPRWGSSNLKHSGESKGVSKEAVEQWRKTLSDSEALWCERVSQEGMARLDYPLEFLGKVAPMTLLPGLLSFPVHAVGVLFINPKRAWIQLRAVLGSRVFKRRAA